MIARLFSRWQIALGHGRSGRFDLQLARGLPLSILAVLSSASSQLLTLCVWTVPPQREVESKARMLPANASKAYEAAKRLAARNREIARRRNGAWPNSRMAVQALILNREHALSQGARSTLANSSARCDPTTSFSPPLSVTRTPWPPLATYALPSRVDRNP